MLKIFFISVLVITSRVPSEGWIQWTQSYSDRELCQLVIHRDYEKIKLAVGQYFGGALKEIREMRCMTYKKAVELNHKLGH